MAIYQKQHVKIVSDNKILEIWIWKTRRKIHKLLEENDAQMQQLVEQLGLSQATISLKTIKKKLGSK